MSSWSGHSSVMMWHHHGWSNRQESVGKRWLVRAHRGVALEVRSRVGLWCFAWVLEFAGVPSGLLGESSFVVLWSWSDLLPEFASLERELTCVAG